MKRRQLLLGTVSALAAGAASDTAASIANDINGGRTGMLTGVQTTHATERAVASLVARDTPSVASLVKWSKSGKALLGVNATGILAKVGSPAIDNEAVSALRADAQVCELYLTAVLHRVLGLDWDTATNHVASRDSFSPHQLHLLQSKLSNPDDSGARYCSILLLARRQAAEPGVTAALLSALREEACRENVRAIGAALAGVDPLTI